MIFIKLFDNQLQYDKQSVFWDEELAGTATTVHDQWNSSLDLNVNADGDSIIRQLNWLVCLAPWILNPYMTSW